MKNSQFYLLIFVFSVLLSCSKTEENVSLDPPTAEITVDELVREASLRNQEIPFKVINEAGDDVTDISTFYVNDEAIEGSVFSSETIGEFEVYGVYMENGVEITTNVEPFSVIIPKRKVVIEDYTGNWCGFCPRATEAIEDVHELTLDITVVAIHESGPGEPDILDFDQIDLLKDEFTIGGFPQVRLNRTTEWSFPDFEPEDVLAMAGNDTDLAISVNSKFSEGNELVIGVDVVFENGSNSGDKLVVYLLESGILQDQKNYFNNVETSSFYQMGNPIPDFEQNHGLRNSLTGVLGDEIPGTEALATYTRTFSFSVPSDYNTENLSIVAMVVSEDNSARNSQYAEVEENKPFE